MKKLYLYLILLCVSASLFGSTIVLFITDVIYFISVNFKLVRTGITWDYLLIMGISLQFLLYSIVKIVKEE